MPFCRSPPASAADAHLLPLAPTSPLPPPPPPPSPTQLVEEFVFSAAYINSTRQWGKCLHLVVKYRYLPNQYLDYKPLRQAAIGFPLHAVI